jgi:YfiH family protein
MFVQQTAHDVMYMTAPNIAAAHAFTTRAGGVSQGVYSSLNLGQNRGDDPVCVRENYLRISRALDIHYEDIVCFRQVHGNCVKVVTREDRGGIFIASPREADGIVTQEDGVALMVFSADCVPILLHDPVRGVIGAVHAGWRGTAADIAGEAVRRMQDVFGCADIHAAIGPCISKCCFETDIDVRDALYNVLGDETGSFVEIRGSKFMIDLKEANRRLLGRAGVRDIEISDECTFCNPDKYWSHRRMKTGRGSQAAIIAIKGAEL